MTLKEKYYDDLPDHPDSDGEYNSHVVVEWLKFYGNPTKGEGRIIKTYVPADAWKKNDGSIIIRYEHHPNGSYEPYFVYYKYFKDNCPKLYTFTSVGVRESLLLALGVLLGYDEENDCLKPFLDYKDEKGNDVYEKWYNIEQLKENWKICYDYYKKGE